MDERGEVVAEARALECLSFPETVWAEEAEGKG